MHGVSCPDQKKFIVASESRSKSFVVEAVPRRRQDKYSFEGKL